MEVRRDFALRCAQHGDILQLLADAILQKCIGTGGWGGLYSLSL